MTKQEMIDEVLNSNINGTPFTPTYGEIFLDILHDLSVYHPGGEREFANLPEPESKLQGFVYSVKDNFTTDERFLEGPGIEAPAGSNVVIVLDEKDMTYKFDLLSTSIDMAGVEDLIEEKVEEAMDEHDEREATQEEINTVIDGLIDL